MVFRRRRLSKKARRWIIIVIALIIAALAYAEFQVEPMMNFITVNRSQMMATEAVNSAVDEVLTDMEIDYERLVTLNYSDSGELQTIETNVLDVNMLKSAITLKAQEKIADIYDKEISFQAGALTGLEMLNNIGPNMYLSVSLTGSVLTEIESSFEEAGVNQTLHTINMKITANITVASTGAESDTTVETNFIVAQTVIVGDVPSFYSGKNNTY